MATSMQQYLKRYTSDTENPKKKKKRPKVSKPAGAITITDADPIWQKEVKEISSESEESQDDAPLVIKDVEVKRMQRLEALKMHRPYISTAEDGSGWVAVGTASNGGNLSPHDTHQGDRISSSPMREHEFSEAKPEPQDIAGSLDLSPPRRSIKILKMDRSPLRKGEDLSPPRGKNSASRGDHINLSSPRRNLPADLSPSRKLHVSSPTRAGSPDMSPPRKRSLTSRLSPSRRKIESQHAVIYDISPTRVDHSNLSSPRRNSPADLSPPRKIHVSSRRKSPTRAGSPDLSPPRKRSLTSRLSPLRKAVVDDLSPPRKPVSIDSSYPRKRHISAESGARNGEEKKEVMTDGTTAGLRTGGQLAKEIKVKKVEDSRRFKEMDASITGRNANTIYRDKHGRRLESLDELLKLQQVEKAPKEDKPLEWGKGLVQRRKHQETLAEIEAEKAKPFARTRDDPELDKQLKEEVRWGDPMAHLIKKKQIAAESALVDLGASEQMKESGFVVPQTIPNHSWLKRNVTAPPNRYNIRPGRHWDGVDRSTGYERDMYKRQNEKKANEVEAYLWSVADM